MEPDIFPHAVEVIRSENLETLISDNTDVYHHRMQDQSYLRMN